MTKKVEFKVPSLKRAIKAAHKLGLEVSDYEIAPDGSIRVQLRDYEVTPDGTIRVHEEAA